MKNYFKKSILPILFLVLIMVGSCKDEGEKPQAVEPKITSFKVIEPTVIEGVVNEMDKTITIYVPSGVEVNSAKVEIEVPSGATVSPTSNAVVDLSNPVQFTVTGRDEDGTEITQVYTASAVHTATIVFVGKAANIDVLEDDAKAAAEWMEETYGNDFAYLPASAINDNTLSSVQVIFYYELEISPSINLGAMANLTVAQAISKFVKNGGQLLLAGDASQYVFNINRVPTAFAFGENNFGSVEENKPAEDYWGFSVVPTTTSADRTSHPLFEGLLTEENRVYLNNAPTREVRLVWWNVGPDVSGGACCGELEMVTNFENKLKAVKLASLRHVTDYFGFAAIEFGRTDMDTHADIHASVPKDFKGTVLVLANSIIGYEWNVNDGSTNEYHENIIQLTENAISYLKGLHDAL